MPLRTLEIPKMNAGEEQSLLESINKYIPLVKQKKAIQKLASSNSTSFSIQSLHANSVLTRCDSSTYSEMGMICDFDHI